MQAYHLSGSVKVARSPRWQDLLLINASRALGADKAVYEALWYICTGPETGTREREAFVSGVVHEGEPYCALINVLDTRCIIWQYGL